MSGEQHKEALRAIDETVKLFRRNLVEDTAAMSEEHQHMLRVKIDELERSKFRLVQDQHFSGGGE